MMHMQSTQEFIPGLVALALEPYQVVLTRQGRNELTAPRTARPGGTKFRMIETRRDAGNRATDQFTSVDVVEPVTTAPVCHTDEAVLSSVDMMPTHSSSPFWRTPSTP